MGLINLKEGRLKTSSKQSTKGVFLVFCSDKANDKMLNSKVWGRRMDPARTLCALIVPKEAKWKELTFIAWLFWNLGGVKAEILPRLRQGVLWAECLVFETARETPGGFPGTRQKWVFSKKNKEQIKVNGLAQEKQPCRVMGAELWGEAEAGASSEINIMKIPVAKDIP